MTLSILLLQGGVVTADVYKWTDADGHVHYGDRPGTDKATPVDILPAPPRTVSDRERIKRRERLLRVLDEEKLERRQHERERRTARQERRQKCETARLELDEVVTSTYLFVKTDDPLNPRIFTEEEREAETEMVRDKVEKWCN